LGIIKHSEIMVEKNIYLMKLENRLVQDEVFDLLRVRNPFFIFEKAGQLELFADRAMFIGTQPAEGEDYSRTKSEAKDPLG
ncbi:20198_t:CDS:1, partial [Gigaspora margarita]